PGHAFADREQDAGLFEREKLGAHIRLGLEIRDEEVADGVAAFALDGELVGVDGHPYYPRTEDGGGGGRIMPVEGGEVGMEDFRLGRLADLRRAGGKDENSRENEE